jgi:hypothetical protein
MIKHIVILLILLGCASAPKNREVPFEEREDVVTLPTALDQAQASYVRGCVDAFHEMKKSMVFVKCREMGLLHRQELNAIMIPGSSSSSDQPKN